MIGSERLTASTQWEIDAARPLWKHMGEADLAHVLALRDAKLIPSKGSRSLLKALLNLHVLYPGSIELTPVRGDLYKNREAWLKDHAPKSVGWLATGRARRESTTVAYHLCLRDKLILLARESLSLGNEIRRLAQSHLHTPMPDYTYLQPAQPTSLGHYLSSFLPALLRDHERWTGCYSRANRFPGGIGSTNGTTLPIDRERIATSLGFERAVEHARDAVWQADLALECTYVASSTALSLSRLAEDIMIWCTREFGFVTLGDEASRASVAMPQKKNPYNPAFIRGVASLVSGRLSSSMTLGRTPTNQIDNRIFAYNETPETLELVTSAVQMMRVTLAGLKFNTQRMRSSALEGFTHAMDLTEALIRYDFLDHTVAHAIIMKAIESNPKADDLLPKVDSLLRARSGSISKMPRSVRAKMTNLEARLEARSGLGGASSKRTSEYLATATVTLRGFEKELAILTRKKESAISRLMKRAKELSKE